MIPTVTGRENSQHSRPRTVWHAAILGYRPRHSQYPRDSESGGTFIYGIQRRATQRVWHSPTWVLSKTTLRASRIEPRNKRPQSLCERQHDQHQLESRMRKICQSGSEEAETNRPSIPRSNGMPHLRALCGNIGLIVDLSHPYGGASS